MRILRMVLAAFVMAGLSTAVVAQEKKADNKKLIVGKWEAVKVDADTLPKGSVVEFLADGKLKVSMKMDGKEEKMDGSYTLDGDTFNFTMKVMDMEFKQKITIKKLDDKELVTTDPDGKGVTFERKK